jgi:hypothetical protein
MRWLHMFGGCTTYAAEAADEITYMQRASMSTSLKIMSMGSST